MAKTNPLAARKSPKTPKGAHNASISKQSSAKSTQKSSLHQVSAVKETPKSQDKTQTPKSKSKTPRPIAKTGNPYPTPKWPSLPGPQQVELSNLLKQILSPIAQWRSQIPKSKGKRAAAKQKQKPTTANDELESQTKSPIPPAPPLTKHITIGLNSTTRALESQSSSALAASSSSTPSSTTNPSPHPNPLLAIFTTHPFPSLLNAHLPLLTIQSSTPVALVQLHSSSERDLVEALGVPRVGMVGVKKRAEEFEDVWEMLEGLEGVEVPWVKDVKTGMWRGVKIEWSDGFVEGAKEGES